MKLKNGEVDEDEIAKFAQVLNSYRKEVEVATDFLVETEMGDLLGTGEDDVKETVAEFNSAVNKDLKQIRMMGLKGKRERLQGAYQEICLQT